jgi:hypothetical protein
MLMTQHAYYSIKYITLSYLCQQVKQLELLEDTHLHFTNILIWIKKIGISFNFGYVYKVGLDMKSSMHYAL